MQGTGSGGALVTLYFDAESGLLVRQVRYVPSPVGRLPTQIDYADYREVAGVKLPFRWTVTWLDGKDTVELKDVRPNVAIDAARFARPRPPVPHRRAEGTVFPSAESNRTTRGSHAIPPAGHRRAPGSFLRLHSALRTAPRSRSRRSNPASPARRVAASASGANVSS